MRTLTCELTSHRATRVSAAGQFLGANHFQRITGCCRRPGLRRSAPVCSKACRDGLHGNLGDHLSGHANSRLFLYSDGRWRLQRRNRVLVAMHAIAAAIITRGSLHSDDKEELPRIVGRANVPWPHPGRRNSRTPTAMGFAVVPHRQLFGLIAQIRAEHQRAEVKKREVDRAKLRSPVVKEKPRRGNRDGDFLAAQLRADRGKVPEDHQAGRSDWGRMRQCQSKRRPTSRLYPFSTVTLVKGRRSARLQYATTGLWGDR